MHRTNLLFPMCLSNRISRHGLIACLVLAVHLCFVTPIRSEIQSPAWSPIRDNSVVLAQANASPADASGSGSINQNAAIQGSDSVRLDLSPQISLRSFVEIVIRRLRLNVVYDDVHLEKMVSLRAPKSLPTDALLPLLRVVLKANNLTLQDTDIPGWQRIVPILGKAGSSRLPALAPLHESGNRIEEIPTGEAITQAFRLQRAAITEVNNAIKPFLSKGANSLVLEDQRMLIVSDFSTNLKKVSQLVELMDGTDSESRIEFVRLIHTDSVVMEKRLSELLRAQGQGAGNSTTQSSALPSLSADKRTNQLMVVGRPSEIRRVLDLVARLDVPSLAVTKIHALENISAERMNEVIAEMLGDSESMQFRSAVDSDSNKLLVTATPEIQARVAALISNVDVARSQKQSPVRFYKLKNVTAVELLRTLRSIEGQGDEDTAYGFGSNNVRGISGATRNSYNRTRSKSGIPGNAPVMPRYPVNGLPPPSDVLYRGQNPTDAEEESRVPLAPGKARITADEGTNTVIVVADPEQQRVYDELIQALDQRRPQVMVEARLVLIDANDDFSLGVEVSGGDRTGEKRAFAFTSYGLSTVGPAGNLGLTPGRGFNGTLVDPDVADVVVRALARHRRARVLSAPRLVVYDNATGVLASVNEEPFENSVVPVAGNTVQSFGGFAEAGTTIQVTPHISGDDYLRLEYTITVNTFTGPSTGTSPPPRKTDEINSVVTIPDGHTVIVGGLNQRRNAGDYSGLPLIEKVPGLRMLGGSESNSSSTSCLFVFLRPVILRDDKFRDLRTLSKIDVNRAKVRGDHPRTEPLLIK